MTVGVYAGSFNPFHKGHYNILLKAEKIFDKVIIARGVNPEKSKSTWELPSILFDRDIRKFSGLLTDFIDIDLFEYKNVTLIRGLRNSSDLQFEMTQYRFYQDLKPNIQVISIFCDKEYEHISSSAIRLLTTFGEDKVKNYLLE